MDLLSIISLLSDGEFHSGSELGEKLGVSRTAVWKAISGLERYGLEVESVKGKGYKLPRSLDLVSSESVLRSLSSSVSSNLLFEAHDILDSTNSRAAELVAGSSSEYICVFSEMQKAGRGRRGRQWFSPFAQNIYMSLAFNLDGGAERIAGLSLVAGLSVRKAIGKFLDADVKLKWPNDVMLDGKKLAGLLVELQGEVADAWRVVVGVGLNYSMSDSDAAEMIDQPWVALGDRVQVTRSEFLAALIESLVEDMSLFKQVGFEGFYRAWNCHDFFEGHDVSVLGSEISGRSMGVDVFGNLLLETPGGLKTINAGEVSVRRIGS